MGVGDATRRVLDGALDAVVAMDREGAIVGWNRAAEALFGWARDEVLGRPVREVIVPARDRGAFLDGLRGRSERTLVHRDGRELATEVSATATGEGDCVVVTAFIRDIGERLRAERLRETEHRITRLLATVPGGRELTAACQPILGEGLGWAAVEGYLLDGGELRLIARWGSVAQAPAIELAERARRRGGMVVEPGAMAAPVAIGGTTRGVTVLRDAPERSPRKDEVAVFANITRALEQYGERRLAEMRLERETVALAEVARATRRLSGAASSAEARQALCDAARQVTGASVAFVAEPDPDSGELVVTAMAGEARDTDAAERAYATGEPVFSGDALAQPLTRNDHVLGVLGISWDERVDRTSDTIHLLVGMLADEGAVALSRAEVFTSLVSAARTDPLTGLPNLRGWDEALTRELARARRTGRPFSVALLDIDGFKQINDSGGHQAGDRALREAVSAWMGTVRTSDLIARIGGDEFAVALPDCDREGAQDLGERLRAATPEPCTCSVGAAEWRVGEAAEELLQRADEALYTAKNAGRNRTIAAP